ncbi:hypothetical protein E2C01_032311 [Portunus trituberculatus]|uniref:Uncharacterized protein n=1 Tax=Portunus trituberculatus TaxID=210409 RepID=A0A5B7EZB2_PORTR|nr:hypothetical protein [Portunus trituberculatus]
MINPPPISAAAAVGVGRSLLPRDTKLIMALIASLSRAILGRTLFTHNRLDHIHARPHSGAQAALPSVLWAPPAARRPPSTTRGRGAPWARAGCMGRGAGGGGGEADHQGIKYSRGQCEVRRLSPRRSEKLNPVQPRLTTKFLRRKASLPLTALSRPGMQGGEGYFISSPTTSAQTLNEIKPLQEALRLLTHLSCRAASSSIPSAVGEY